MLAPLLGMPVLLCLALLPVTLVAALVWLRMPATIRWQSAHLLAGIALLLLAAGFLVQLAFAVLYLTTPNYLDHIEPNTAIVAWIYGQGGELYHAVDAPERYAFLYGPLPYMVTSWLYSVLGGSALAAKLAGFFCLLGSYIFIVLAVRKRYSGHWIPCVIALGYFALCALLFKNHSFWSKPDPFMIMAAAAGLYSCLLRPGRMAWVLCGIALGIAVNAKITGAVYFLPFVAWFFDRDGMRAVLVALLAAAVTALLPFTLTEQVSLANYLSWLQAAGGHGLTVPLLLQNAVFLLFLALPALCFFAWQVGSVGIRSWLENYRLVSFASIVAAFLVYVAASKNGSGPHHFLPFLPALAFLVAHMCAAVYAYKPVTHWSVFGFWAPAAAFLVALIVKVVVALSYLVPVVIGQAGAAAVVADIRQIVADNPGRNIYMGYGDGSSYSTTFLRTELAFAGEPYLVDAAALMDFQLSGIDIPASTRSVVLEDKTAIWLVPTGQQPFTLVNWYYRSSGGMLFDEQFRAVFNDVYAQGSTTKYFDLYMQSGGVEPGP